MTNNEFFTSEREGQIEFYRKFLPLVDSTLSEEDILQDFTDGVINGNILEFKLVISDLSKVLSQAIKYLSAMRVKGKSIPKNIILISLVNNIAYIYDSSKYIKDIEKIYIGSASKDNFDFSSRSYEEKLHYTENSLDTSKLIKYLRSTEFTPINIDENCIVGWAERYYKENPNSHKSDFIGDNTGKVKIIGEIRNPSHFKGLINPYEKESNIRFQYLMDKLNDDLNKKDLGAFYTPLIYAEKSFDLLYQAIERVPEGNDFIILDRCAGTGNLVKNLPEKYLKHCVLSTIEYYEYKVLLEVLGDKVRDIIPPFEDQYTFQGGLVRGADALSEEYVYHPVLREYIEDEKMTIIIFENPPYAEVNGITRSGGGKSKWKNTFVGKSMQKEIKGSALNDLANLFIWSGFKYYLREKTDSMIVYAPIKYWKSHHLVNKEFINGFAFNRRGFNTKTNAMISCILWGYNDDNTTQEIQLEAYNINSNNSELEYEGILNIPRVYSLLSKYYDRKSRENDTLDGIITNLDGTERIPNGKERVKPVDNSDIVGYLIANGNGFDNPRLNSSLVRINRYDGNGFILRKENYLELLPLLSAGKYTDHKNDWKIMSNIMKSSDKKNKYLTDIKDGKLDDFLLKNLFWVTMTHYAHLRTIKGSNGKLYRNEFSLDTTHGETLSSKKLKEMKKTKEEKEIIEIFNKVLEYAKETKEYDEDMTYGVYQIDQELNTRYKDEKLNKTIYNYPRLNGEINVLKRRVKDYYINNLESTLRKYEFIK